MVIWKLAPGRGCPAPDIGPVRDATIAGLESIKEGGRILGRYRSLYLSRGRVKKQTSSLVGSRAGTETASGSPGCAGKVADN